MPTAKRPCIISTRTKKCALQDAGLIEGEESEYGLFVTEVDGIEADSANQEWWCLTINGEMASTGVDSTPVEDGGKYEFTLTVGY